MLDAWGQQSRGESHQVQKPNEFKPTNCDVKIKILEWDFINFVTL